jgi:hypothetical protein
MIAKDIASDRVELLRWVARLGAVTDEALARRRGVSLASARATLGAAARSRQLARHRPLADSPSLYTITRSGLRAAGLSGVEPCRVGPAGAHHMIVCASVASTLQLLYPQRTLIGEQELRRREREDGALLASVVLRRVGERGAFVHRPDLVLLEHAEAERPVAVEVELTVKAPRRLAEICRAWARSRHVAGVLYLAPPRVQRALNRAVERAQAHERVVVLPLAAVDLQREPAARGPAPSVASQASPSVRVGSTHRAHGEQKCPTFRSIESRSSGA